MKITMYTQTGEKKGDVEVNDKIFAVKPNEQLIHQALVRQMANSRQATAHVKTRGEVTGSTRKIYRQKGTGGARHGSRYSNIFRGGGRVFGPRNVKNYTKAMPRKQRRLALFSALSIVAGEKKIIALFGPTCPQEIDLYGQGSKLFAGVDCSPCYKQTCPHIKCMEEITPEQVFAEVQKLI